MPWNQPEWYEMEKWNPFGINLDWLEGMWFLGEDRYEDELDEHSRVAWERADFLIRVILFGLAAFGLYVFYHCVLIFYRCATRNTNALRSSCGPLRLFLPLS